MSGGATDWRERRASAFEAVSTVRAGQRVFVGSACGTPRTLVDALERWDERPAGVVLVHFLTDRVGLGDPPSSRYRHRVFYVGADVRALIGSAPVDYVPLSLAESRSYSPAAGWSSTWRWSRSRPRIGTGPAASACRST